MGFLSGIGKAIKNVTKAVSLNNVIKVSTGRADEVIKEVVNRTKGGIQMIVGDAVGSLKGSTKSSVKSTPVVLQGAGKIATNAQLVKTGIKTSSGLPLKANLIPAKTQFAVKASQIANSGSPVYAGKSSDSKGVVEEFVDYLTDFWGRKIDKATGELIQDGFKEPIISSFMDRFKKEALKFYWWKYKPYFIVGLGSLVAFLVYWFKFRKPKRARRR